MINDLTHGFEQTKIQKSGGFNFTKRTKYCRVHGLIDVGYPEGEENWEKQHALCGEGFPPLDQQDILKGNLAA